MVGLEGIQPTPFTELDTEAQRSEGLASGHAAGRGRASAQSSRPPLGHRPPHLSKGQCLLTVRMSLVELIIS